MLRVMLSVIIKHYWYLHYRVTVCMFMCVHQAVGLSLISECAAMDLKYTSIFILWFWQSLTPNWLCSMFTLHNFLAYAAYRHLQGKEARRSFGLTYRYLKHGAIQWEVTTTSTATQETQ
jgi:hypothetical protein